MLIVLTVAIGFNRRWCIAVIWTHCERRRYPSIPTTAVCAEHVSPQLRFVTSHTDLAWELQESTLTAWITHPGISAVLANECKAEWKTVSEQGLRTAQQKLAAFPVASSWETFSIFPSFRPPLMSRWTQCHFYQSSRRRQSRDGIAFTHRKRHGRTVFLTRGGVWGTNRGAVPRQPASHKLLTEGVA